MRTAIHRYLRIAVFCCLLFSGMNLDAQDWARKMFKETAFNFGDVLKGEMPEHRFEIENIYVEDLQIDQVFTSCPCIIVSVADNKRVLKTREKAYVVCKFNSPAFDGKRKATVTVRFRRPFVGEVQINLTGNIIRGINFTPNSIDFGQVSEKNLTSKTIRIASSGSSNFRVVDVKSTFHHVGVQLKETARNQNLVSYEMTVRLKPTIPGGFSQGELYIIVQENGLTRQMPIKFSAKVFSNLQMTESVTIAPVKPGQQCRKKIILKSDVPFKVTDVTCRNSAYRIKADGHSKKIHYVELIYTAGDSIGEFEDELAFFIDNLPEPAGKLKVYGEVATSSSGSSSAGDQAKEKSLGKIEK